ncbi:1,6-anhydro-N-acetylmuramyl-L-alanine amidase AmpD [Moraxella sp. VT-16-12]|uniref:1,6-anhydro-N-acetylmuramyl-L-alanine amidase AmpD n=1 Tax=Moraxella sp. VT-16-12 TaxID=2014877 RepID=UPI000B7E38CD|nr:1,6-anhydro-N-acetylmuramyl-L-alanine amidase AmpD [Moraxella sp. VT-16-12]TWV80344.1 1,6-anhydro-N-acetylmuramyl-L-alanine amidase AmpD [Moraxella sp. VT-16-12]
MTTFTIKDGILSGATFVPSPNFNTRPTTDDKPAITGIVIHNISLPPSQFGQTDKTGTHFVKAFFQNKLDPNDHDYFKTIAHLEVSAHLFIERHGAVTQFVNFNERAWHAGQSCYLGRANCNDFTIGIELEGDDFSPFSDKQYNTLAQIIVAIYHAYPATKRHLMGHSDIAPIRKTDPGEFFDWGRLRKLVHEHL